MKRERLNTTFFYFLNVVFRTHHDDNHVKYNMGLVSPRTYQLKTVLVILLREYNFPPATHKNQNRDKSGKQRDKSGNSLKNARKFNSKL